MNQELLDKVIEEVKKPGNNKCEENKQANECCCVTEFVGTAIGDTIGLVIANVDYELHKKMGIDPEYRSIGILGARVGAGPHIMAIDEAVKATNSKIISIELPRDTKGGAGHGSLIIVGSKDVSDSRRAIEVALEYLNKSFGDVYATDAGHIEFQYTARADAAINKVFGCEIGKAFGLVCAGPAAIGVLLADTAVKAANVEILSYSSPSNGGTSYSNEVILTFSGDSAAVHQAVVAARELGLKLLKSLGGNPTSLSQPYI